MEKDLIKRFVDICGELQEVGVFGIMEKRLHVLSSTIKEMENLQIKNRGDFDYPYEVFTMVEGVKIFSLESNESIKEYPQFTEFRKADLKRQLAELEVELGKEEEATA